LIAIYAQLGIEDSAAVAGVRLHRGTLYLTILVFGATAMIRDSYSGKTGISD
jgi:hypothetical protein